MSPEQARQEPELASQAPPEQAPRGLQALPQPAALQVAALQPALHRMRRASEPAQQRLAVQEICASIPSIVSAQATFAGASFTRRLSRFGFGPAETNDGRKDVLGSPVRSKMATSTQPSSFEREVDDPGSRLQRTMRLAVAQDVPKNQRILILHYFHGLAAYQNGRLNVAATHADFTAAAGQSTQNQPCSWKPEVNRRVTSSREAGIRATRSFSGAYASFRLKPCGGTIIARAPYGARQRLHVG